MYRLISSILLVAFILNQVARISIGEVGITLLDICVGSVSIGWFIKHVFQLRVIIGGDRVGKAWTYFLVAALFSLTVNIGYLSFLQFSIAFLYLLRFICYSSMFFIIRQCTKGQKAQIPQLLTITGITIVVLGFLQYFFYPNLRNLFYLGWDEHMYRLFSVFLDPNFAGAFYVLFIVFLKANLLHTSQLENIREQFGKKLLLLLTIVALLLTFSRSALIMFVVSLFLLFILENKRKLILFLFLGVGVFILSISQFFYIENINLFRTASSNARIESTSHAVQIFLERPVFGVGFNAYKYAQVRLGYRQENPKIVSHADGGTDNSWLFILATTGIVGMYFFLAFWYQIVRNLCIKRDMKMSMIIGLVSIVGLFVDSIFLNSLFYPSLMLWLFVVLGINDYK